MTLNEKCFHFVNCYVYTIHKPCHIPSYLVQLLFVNLVMLTRILFWGLPPNITNLIVKLYTKNHVFSIFVLWNDHWLLQKQHQEQRYQHIWFCHKKGYPQWNEDCKTQCKCNPQVNLKYNNYKYLYTNSL